MKDFSFNRFCKTFRWHFGVCRRELLMWVLGAMGSTLLTKQFIIGMREHYQAGLSFFSQFASIALMISVLVALSFYLNWNKKTSRQMLLMLPASSLEKWLTALVYITFVWPACVLVAFCLGDALHAVIYSLFFDGTWPSAVPGALKALEPAALERETIWWPELIFIVLMVVWIHSLYIFAGTLMRKYAFVVASLVLVGLPIVIMNVCNYFSVGDVSLFIYDLGVQSTQYELPYVNPLVYVLDGVFVVFAIFNYWAALHIFKNFELITNKWTNYDILKR